MSDLSLVILRTQWQGNDFPGLRGRVLILSSEVLLLTPGLPGRWQILLNLLPLCCISFPPEAVLLLLQEEPGQRMAHLIFVDCMSRLSQRLRQPVLDIPPEAIGFEISQADIPGAQQCKEIPCQVDRVLGVRTFATPPEQLLAVCLQICEQRHLIRRAGETCPCPIMPGQDGADCIAEV